jgi:hypothetical protein
VFSGLVLLSRQLGTQKQGQKQGQSWRQWSSGRCSRKRPEFTTWMTVQSVFSQSELVFLRVHSCLELTEVWHFPGLSLQLFWMQQKSCWIDSMANVFNLFWPMVLHVNVYPFKLRKETLKPRLGPHTLSTKKQWFICNCLQLATDSFQTSHCLVWDFQLVV